MAGRICFSMGCVLQGEADGGDGYIDELDADERHNDAADAIDQEIAALHAGGADFGR